MCEAHYMLAMSLQHCYLVDEAMVHYKKSMTDACRPDGLFDDQWRQKRSDTCAHMARIYRCAHARILRISRAPFGSY
jgi:hypothetical protein